MDPQIEELKELVRQNTVLTQETNAMVKSLHRASVWGRVIKFVGIGIAILISIVTYIYLMPYLSQLMDFYGTLQEAIEEARQLGSQFQNPSGQ